MKRWVLLLVLIALMGATGERVLANSLVAKKIFKAKRINPHAPVINGVLDDLAWGKANVGKDFVQLRPYEGEKTSQETEFMVMYDNENLYIAVRAFDTNPGEIARRMARRDNVDGDMITVQIDSYHDLRTAFSFSVNAAGVKGDTLISENGDKEDANWDPVWYAATRVDDRGWVAEMKIPFSQLRFGKKGNGVWGLQVTRNLFRKDERSGWVLIPIESLGLVNHFGELHGLVDLKTGRRVELMPYFVGRTQSFEAEEGNPFNSGKSSNLVVGLDGKIGITNDLTLDFTVNPDFGQVEADPSEVNLTDLETYFNDKRPFFIEGREMHHRIEKNMGVKYNEQIR